MKKRNIKDLGKDLAAKKKELQTYLAKDFPRLVANDALQTFDDSWDKQGFTDEKGTFKKWEDRKDPIDPEEKKPNRGILIGKGSGILRRSLEVKSATAKRIVIGTPIKYAQIHNEGGTIVQTPTFKQRMFFSHKGDASKTTKAANTWAKMSLAKKLTIPIPKRQFMGNSKPLIDKIRTRLENKMNKTFEQ